MLKIGFIYIALIGMHTGLFAQDSLRSNYEPEIAIKGKRVSGMLDRYLSRSMMLALFTDHVDRPGYIQQMEMIRKLKPAYLSRIAGSWGLPETDLLPGGKLYHNTKQIIDDVRRIYREDSVAMPMIEAGIFEAITSDVNRIAIPEWVLLAFADDPEASKIKPRRGRQVYFNADSMRNNSQPNWSAQTWVPDINRIHTRMWFYYLSSIFIDMGCQSIHFGWFELITAHDSLFVKTDRLFQRIRQYAKGKNSFVIFNADTDGVAYVNNTNRILLDFVSSPLRPEATANSFHQSPCEGDPMTELDIPRYNKGLMDQRGGVTAEGDTVKNIPVLFNIDWYGVSYKGKRPGQMGPGEGGWSPWAVNESIWFYSLSDECQAYWLENISIAIKNSIVERGYVKIPAIQPLTWWGYPVTEYLLTRNKKLVSNIKNRMWKLDTAPFFTITNFSRKSQHMLNVSNPDLTSIYSWHILQKDTGEVLPEYTGIRYVLADLPPGNYRITLRRDNAMFAGQEDVQLVKKEIKIE